MSSPGPPWLIRTCCHYSKHTAHLCSYTITVPASKHCDYQSNIPGDVYIKEQYNAVRRRNVWGNNAQKQNYMTIPSLTFLFMLLCQVTAIILNHLITKDIPKLFKDLCVLCLICLPCSLSDSMESSVVNTQTHQIGPCRAKPLMITLDRRGSICVRLQMTENDKVAADVLM